MKKLAFALAIAVFGVAVAQKTLTDLFYPSEELMKTACDEGYAAGEKQGRIELLLAGMKYVYTSDLKQEILPKLNVKVATIEVQFPLGRIFMACYNMAKQLKPKNYTALVAFQGTLGVFLEGEVRKLENAKEWAVALSIRAKGQELARVFPKSKDVGSLGRWSVDCSKDCVWKGSNVYLFEAIPPDNLQEADAIVVLYNVGYGTGEVVVASLSSTH